MPDTRPARILMVDDRPENLLALEAILHGLGHELVSANSGEDALKRLLSEEFALILLDVQMPGMDGFETAAHIKQRARTRDVPIVFLTAMEGEAHQAFRGYTAGAVDFLAKPFDPWVLRAKVAVFIELDERRREMAARADDLRRRLTALDPAELDRLASEVCAALGRARALCDAPAAPELTAAIDTAARSACELRDRLPHDDRTGPNSGPNSGLNTGLNTGPNTAPDSGLGDPTR